MPPKKKKNLPIPPWVIPAPVPGVGLGGPDRDAGGGLGGAVGRQVPRPGSFSSTGPDGEGGGFGIPPPPGVGSQFAGPAPIGVPPGYVAVVPGRPGRPYGPESGGVAQREGGLDVPTREVQPSFFDGMQYAPASLPPAQIAALQRQLAALGLIPSDASITYGVWDNQSIAAYEDLLSWANRAGITSVAEAIRQFQIRGGAVEQPDQRAPLIIQETSADELRPLFRRAVMELTGEGWDAGRIERMVQAYQGEERSIQQEAYELEGSEQAGTIETAPSPEAFAEAEINRQDPSAIPGREWLGRAEEFFAAVGGL